MDVKKAIEAYVSLSPADKILAHEELNKILRYKDLIMKICRQEKYGVQDDIFQLTCLKALTLEFTKAGDDEKYYKNLICKAAHNLAIDMRRERKRWVATVEEEKMADIEAEGKEEGNGVSSFVSPLVDAMNKETQRKVETLMERMAEGSETYTLYVKIFKMEMFDGIKPVEIARRLHVERNYVDVAVRRVRDRLRTLYKN